jgi:membrane protein
MASLIGLFKDAAMKWMDDSAPSAGAAIAFYTIFSLAPVIMIVLAVIGALYGEEAARGTVFTQLQGLFGAGGAKAIEELIQNADQPQRGFIAAVTGPVIFVLGATAIFVQMQSALNAMWGIKTTPFSIVGYLKIRLLSFSLIIATGFLLIVSLVANAAIVAFGDFVFGEHTAKTVIWWIQLILSIAILAGLFALIFKVLPDTHIHWRAALFGGLWTSFLFTIGKTVIGFYLAKSDVLSSYGAAGTFVLVLLWVYYSSLIFLYGAELTWLRHQRLDEGRVRPPRAVAPASPSESSGAA